MLRIPYAEIEEPFTAYYDLTFKRSRIDFYGGKNVFSMKDEGLELNLFKRGFEVCMSNLANTNSSTVFYLGMDKQFRIGDDGEFGSHVNLSPVTTEKVTNEVPF